MGRIKVTIDFLGNRKELIPAVGEMRWKEWGRPPEPEDIQFWIDISAKEAGTESLPVTWVAVDEDGKAAGAVGLDIYEMEERRDRSPWITGTIVRKDLRGAGIGSVLLAELEKWAFQKGYDTVWVATGNHAVNFYKKTGMTL